MSQLACPEQTPDTDFWADLMIRLGVMWLLRLIVWLLRLLFERLRCRKPARPVPTSGWPRGEFGVVSEAGAW